MLNSQEMPGCFLLNLDTRTSEMHNDGGGE